MQKTSHPCDHWLSGFLFRYPILASIIEVLPGVCLRDIVVEIARAAYDAAVIEERESLGKLARETATEHGGVAQQERETVETPPSVSKSLIHLVTPDEVAQAMERRKARGAGVRAYWAQMTPEQKAAEVEKRFGGRRGRRKAKSDDELMKIAEVLQTGDRQ